MVPFPSHFRASGILRARERSEVINEAPGYVAEILARPGSTVTNGQALMRLKNRELDLELTGALARLDEVQARLLYAMQNDTASLKPMQSRLAATQDRLRQVRELEAALTLTARHDGIWVAPGIEEYLGRWLGRGTKLGLVVNPASFEFTASVLQADGDALFAKKISGAEVRVRGQASQLLTVARWKVIPAEQQVLPSAALGWRGGGEIAVASDDPQGRKAAEPFFEVEAEILPSGPVALLHGRSGKIRFDLESEPLLPRAIKRLRQLLQKRYQL